MVICAVALVFAAVRLARRPSQLPDLPWGLALLVLVSAATYLAAKYAEGGRPVILSVVRAREAGDLDAPIRTGDDIEIRGAGFVPPGAGTADRLSRMVVRIGPVHVHVPLVPVAGGSAIPRMRCLPCLCRWMWSRGGWRCRWLRLRGWRRIGA